MSVSFKEACAFLTPVPTAPIAYTVEDVESCFGVTFTPEERASLDAIPFSESVLRASAGTHMLFPSCSLSLLSIRDRHSALFYSRTEGWYAKEQEAFSRAPLAVRWNLLRMDAVPESFSMAFAEQQQLLGSDEEVPSAPLVAFAAVLHCWKTQQRLFPSFYVRTSDVDADRDRVFVGLFDGYGLGVDCLWHDVRVSSIGVAAVRKS